MARGLLSCLNGGRQGELFQWLSEFEGEVRKIRFPSVDIDYRNLLYLAPVYSAHDLASECDMPLPDLFILTDYRLWSSGEPFFVDSM